VVAIKTDNIACVFHEKDQPGSQAPTRHACGSMINWDTAAPNAPYWVLYLIDRNFGSGVKLVAITSSSPDVVGQASITAKGRKLLLINISDHAAVIALSNGFATGPMKAQVVEESSGENQPRIDQPVGSLIQLAPLAVAVRRPRNNSRAGSLARGPASYLFTQLAAYDASVWSKSEMRSRSCV